MRVAICDDQDEWVEQIEKYLTRFKQSFQNIKWESFYSAEEFLNYIGNRNNFFDILITDIEMEKINGIELAKRVREKDSGIVIFFLTSHDEYIRQCFAPRPLGFWDKPLEYVQFEKDMTQAVNFLKNNSDVFSFKDKNGYMRIPYSNIIYFRTNGKKIIVHTFDTDYEFYGTFKNHEKIWKSAGFVKANRFYYLNSEFIFRFKPPNIYLQNGEKIKSTQSSINTIKMIIFKSDCYNAVIQMED